MIRPISKPEAELLARVLSAGANEPLSPELAGSIPTLQVTALCRCGCATVWFGPDGEGTLGRNVAEALAMTGGSPVTVIAWAQGSALVGLEVVGHEGPAGLPDALTVKSYGEA